MRPRSWRSSWSRTATLRLQGRNRAVSYQCKFLRRNYGIFVLPAVVHFEDGVPNIYEGLKDFVFAWFFTESPLVSSNPKIHIHTMVDFCSLRVFLHFSTFIVSCYRSSVPCGRLQLAGGAEDNVCYWGGWRSRFKKAIALWNVDENYQQGEWRPAGPTSSGRRICCCSLPWGMPWGGEGLLTRLIELCKQNYQEACDTKLCQWVTCDRKLSGGLWYKIVPIGDMW